MNPLIDSVCIGCEATALFGKGMFGSLAVIRNAGKMWSWYPNLVDKTYMFWIFDVKVGTFGW